MASDFNSDGHGTHSSGVDFKAKPEIQSAIAMEYPTVKLLSFHLLL